MKKTIWIINDYAGSPYHGMEFRHYYLAREWIKKGYSVYIITASYSHLLRSLPKVEGNFTLEKIDGINYLWVKVPKYTNSRDKKRVLKWFYFSIKLFFLPMNKLNSPNVVIASPMATFFAIPAYKIAKKYNAKFIFEVKDIWPLSIIELGNISPKHPLIKIMAKSERFAIEKADYIVSVLPNYEDYLKDRYKLDKKSMWISNGIDTSSYEISKFHGTNKISKVPNNKFIVGYMGTIGLANALEYLLIAARRLQRYKNIHFVIVGSGSEKENLISRFGKLQNVTFLNPVPRSQVQSVLACFDVCYIGWKKKKIYKYGISANKIFDYMYAGKPILHSYSGKGDLIKLANCGITVEAENPIAIAEGILKLHNLPREKLKEMGQKGRKYVLENFTYQKLAEKYENLF